MVDAAANFERFAAIFGCAIAKKRGGGRPCALYCINPFRGLAGALSPSRTLEVEETLWESGRCHFRLA